MSSSATLGAETRTRKSKLELRDAVAGTELRFKELDEKDAVKLGCLSALRRLQRRCLLSRNESLCQAAAGSGQLEELKVLRKNG